MQKDIVYNEGCLEGLKKLPDESVDCCVTSPPYYGLRDYGHGDQIGLEETPDLYVQKMVTVLREVYRVLKPSGTLWLNLGDSYCSTGTGSGDQKSSTLQGGKGTQVEAGKRPSKVNMPGLKPKDLIGIPWAVAKAIQAPFYTGKIKNESDRIWLAAMVDGEGCMFIHKRKAGADSYSSFTKKDGNTTTYSRKNDTYGTGMEIANTHRSIIDRCHQITKVGSTCTVERETALKKRNIPLHRWNLRSNQCREVIKEIYPYLVGKKHEARILLNCPSSGELAEKCHAALMLLHNGKEVDLDFPEPPSMYERGFYLRQDIIWNKLNPMPESVTDRCTKAHEYIFLLSKSAQYYYDFEAVQEVANYDGRKDIIMKGSDKYANGYFPTDVKTQSIAKKGHERWKFKTKSTFGNRGGELDKLHSGKEWIPQVNDDLIAVRNKRSVWTVTTKPFSEAHFATFPQDLIVDCIKSGCPEGGIVLDPFMGAFTTALVAKKLNRHYVGFELNPEYIKIGERRLNKELGMFR